MAKIGLLLRLRRLWNRLKSHSRILFYLTGIFFLILFLLWAFLAPLKVQLRDISILNKIACEVAGIGCKNPGESQNSLFYIERQISEEIVILQAGEDGQAILDKLNELRQVRQEIERAEKQAPTTSLVVLLLGGFFHLAFAFIATFIFYPFIRRLLLGRRASTPNTSGLEKKRQKIFDEIVACCKETSLQKQDVLKIITDLKAEEWREDFEDFINKCSRKSKKQEKISWTSVSKLFFGLANMVRDQAGIETDIAAKQKLLNIENELRSRYGEIRSLIRIDTLINYISKILPVILLLGFYLVFGTIFVLKGGLSKAVFADWWVSISWILFAWIAAVTLYYLSRFTLTALTEKTRTQLDDVLGVAISFPISTIIAVSIAIHAIGLMPPYFKYSIMMLFRLATMEPLTLVITTIIATWVLVLIFNRVIIYALQRWAASTKQTYDDMAVRMLQIFGTFLILAVVGALLVMKFQAEIRATTGVENILLPYAIVVSVITALLGYATKEGVENFFGGLLLQIDKPFNIGDRLMLETGEICDVREVGMRSMKLYNVMDNSEISIPNRVMANQKITNISRPDVQLRIPINIQLGYNNFMLERIDAILLDIAYGDTEVEQSRVGPQEVSDEQRESLGRRSLVEHWNNLVGECPDVLKIPIERILGRGKFEQIPVNDIMPKRLYDIKDLRDHLGIVSDKETNLIEQAIKETELDIKRSPFIRDALLFAMDAIPSSTINEILGVLRESCLNIDTTKSSVTENKPVELVGRLVGNILKDDSRNSQITKLAEQAKLGKYDDNEFMQLIDVIKEWYKGLRLERYSILLNISSNFSEVGEAIYTIRDNITNIKPSTDELVNELIKEPSVYSDFKITEDGRTYIEISFRVFTSHLERKFEVTHRVHEAIRRRFKSEGITVGVPGRTSSERV